MFFFTSLNISVCVWDIEKDSNNKQRTKCFMHNFIYYQNHSASLLSDTWRRIAIRPEMSSPATCSGRPIKCRQSTSIGSSSRTDSDISQSCL